MNDVINQFEHPDLIYVIGGFEVGEQGTRHVQAFVQLKNRKRLTGLKKIFPTAHCEIKKGTVQQAIDYCKKDGDWFEHGVKPKEQYSNGVEATKRKWSETRKLAAENRVEEIEDDMYIRYYGTLKRIAKDNMKKPDDLEDVCGEWYYGEAGTGKTTKARIDNPGAYIKSRDQWWDGYQQEDVVILDDIDKFNVKLGGYLKDWMDKWTFKGEEKGGYKWLRPKKFIVTSQYAIEEIWEDKETRDALNRRCKKIHFNKKL